MGAAGHNFLISWVQNTTFWTLRKVTLLTLKSLPERRQHFVRWSMLEVRMCLSLEWKSYCCNEEKSQKRFMVSHLLCNLGWKQSSLKTAPYPSILQGFLRGAAAPWVTIPRFQNSRALQSTVQSLTPERVCGSRHKHKLIILKNAFFVLLWCKIKTSDYLHCCSNVCGQ